MVLPLLARLTAPAPQTLHTHSPTPSTVSFTVSTRARRTTLAARLLTTLSVLLRLVLSTAALLSLWLKHRLSAGKPIDVLLWVLGGQWTTILLRALGGVGWLYLGVMVAGVLGWAVRRGYTGTFLSIYLSIHPSIRPLPPLLSLSLSLLRPFHCPLLTLPLPLHFYQAR